jgi:hypothetical protein
MVPAIPMVPHPIKAQSKALAAMPGHNLIEYVHDQGIPLGLISRSAIKAPEFDTLRADFCL